MSKLRTSATFSAGGALLYGAALLSVDVLITRRYGLAGQAAAFQAGWQVLTVMLAVLSGGAILGPLMPVVSRALARGGTRALSVLLSRIATPIVTLHVTAAALLIIYAPEIISLAASSFTGQQRQEAVLVLRCLAPLLILHGLASIASASLLAQLRIALVSFTPVLTPFMGIVAFHFGDPAQGAVSLALGYLCGVALQVFVLCWRMRYEGEKVPSIAGEDSIERGPFFRVFVGTACSHALLSAVLFASAAMAGSVSDRDLAALTFGSRLVLMALAFMTTIINTAIFPHLTSLAMREHDQSDLLYRRLRQLFVIFMLGGGLAVAVWCAVADWLVNLLYAHGQFGHSDTELMALVQRLFALQIPFYLVGVLCWRMLNLYSGWLSSACASALALTVILGLGGRLSSSYGAQGVAGAYSAAIVVWSVVLVAALRHQLRRSRVGPTHG